jgi:hypothetical protein
MSADGDRSVRLRVGRLAALALICVAAAGEPAPAEEGGFAGFFSHLFGTPAAKPPESAPTLAPAPHKPKKKVRDFVPAATTRAPGAPGGAPVQASFHIDVIGDSLAVSAAEGLSDAFADKPEIAIVDRSRDASGLVREDYFNWSKTASDFVAGNDKIDFIVIMLGINDDQAMKDGNDTLNPLSDRWLDHYGERVETLVTTFRSAHIPLLWVGLPPMRTDRLNADVVKLNQIFRERVEKAGGKFVDIWDAFANQSGQYDAYGPNVDGQNAKLRGADGIHFTKAGARKVAHFLEAEIRRSLDKNKPAPEVATLPPDIEQAADDINAQIRREMGVPAMKGPTMVQAPTRQLAGPIISLTARPSSAEGLLATADVKHIDETPAIARVLNHGEPMNSRVGRADDFSWPRI